MQSYIDLINDVLTNGEQRSDRTGTGTLSVFGRTWRHNMCQGFPLVTTKRTFWRGAFVEMLWMISGDNNIKKLQEQGVNIWNEWADENGDLGPIYGYQWRAFPNFRKVRAIQTRGEILYEYAGGKDQLLDVIEGIKQNPYSRRHLVTAWNPADIDRMALPPCHYAYQFYVRADKYLDCMVQMRSVDVFLGLPFDIAGYGLLLSMIAYLTGYEPGELVFNLGDTHIYLNHLEQVREQRTREPRPLPQLIINPSQRQIDTIDGFVYTDFVLEGYAPHPPIKGDVSV